MKDTIYKINLLWYIGAIMFIYHWYQNGFPWFLTIAFFLMVNEKTVDVNLSIAKRWINKNILRKKLTTI